MIASPEPHDLLKRPWRFLVICLLFPGITAIVRKLLPGQPAYVEGAAVIPVFLSGLWALRQKHKLPKSILSPLLYWAVFQLAYALPSAFDDWRIGAAAIGTRVIPMLMAPIAFAAVRSWEGFRKAVTWITGLAPLLLPVGFIVALGGNQVLPYWLQPIEKLSILERDFRSGYPTVSAIFTTQWILSLSMLAIFYLGLTYAAEAPANGLTRGRWWFVIAAAFLMIYFSSRRGALWAAAVGLGFFVFSRRPNSWKAGLAVVAILGGIAFVDRYGYSAAPEYALRSDLALDLDPMDRIVRIFLPLSEFWLRQAPLGNYLGFAGPEARALGQSALQSGSTVVEVGAALLLAETGLMGAIVMPLALFIIIRHLYKQSRLLKCRLTIRLLLMYQVVLFVLYYTKELLALANVSLAQFFFWSIPGICAALIQIEEQERAIHFAKPGIHKSDGTIGELG